MDQRGLRTADLTPLPTMRLSDATTIYLPMHALA
jgi:hypothetical protein